MVALREIPPRARPTCEKICAESERLQKLREIWIKNKKKIVFVKYRYLCLRLPVAILRASKLNASHDINSYKFSEEFLNRERNRKYASSFLCKSSSANDATTLFYGLRFLSSLPSESQALLSKLFHVSLSYKMFEKSRRKMVQWISTAIPLQFSNFVTSSLLSFSPAFSPLSLFLLGNTTIRLLPWKEQIRYSRGSCIQDTMLAIERQRYCTRRIV